MCHLIAWILLRIAEKLIFYGINYQSNQQVFIEKNLAKLNIDLIPVPSMGPKQEEANR